MRLIKKLKEKISKKEAIIICVFSVMWVFNYFLFNQFDVMLHNQAEFGVQVAEVVWAFLWRSLLILALGITVLTALCYYSKKAFVIALAVLFGLVLAGYAQVLFMNKEELMAVAGTMALESIGQFIVNMMLYLAIAFIPALLVILAYKKKIKFRMLSTLAIALSVIILGMQTMGVITAAASAPSAAKDNELYYFSVDEQLKLSKNENIIVFIMDRLDTEIANELFTKHDDTQSIFDGFTYYTNNVAEYPGTFPSVPALLTGAVFDMDVYGGQRDFLKDAWQNEKLFTALHANNYTVNTLIDSISSFFSFKDLEGKIDNIKQVNKKDRKVKGGEFFGAMTSFAQTRQSPDALKQAFKNKKYLDIPNYCVEVKNTPDHFPRTISAGSDLRFYEKLKSDGLSASQDKNVFSLVHLQSSHSPILYDQDLNKVKNARNTTKNALAQAYGSFKILDEYFLQMKELGIYENSTIVVLADHGCWNNKKEIDDAAMSALFVKEKGVGGGALVTDSHSQLSNHNFNATILETIGEYDLKGTTLSYRDVIAAGGVQTRYFYYIKWVNLGSVSHVGTYKIEGDANIVSNWIKI